MHVDIDLRDKDIEASMLVVPSKLVDVVFSSQDFSIVLYVTQEGIVS